LGATQPGGQLLGSGTGNVTGPVDGILVFIENGNAVRIFRVVIRKPAH
jgi:hypothetical protein